MDVGTGYRPLEIGEVHAVGDEWFRDGMWHSIAPKFVGLTYYGVSYPFRRPISTESKDSMDQYHEDAMQNATTAPVEVPPDAQTFLSHDERDYISRELGSLMQSIARGARTKEELFRYLTKLAEICGINPDLKPFTPNKYTRWIPTLDGRTVPVDVYCVLAAFPTGSAAVDHAVKKELAPGQRGHKDRIQDLKEARDSLTRAIELEEAQNA